MASNAPQWIYWKEEAAERKWKAIPHTDAARQVAMRKGAMFFTWCRFSEPYKGNGAPEPVRMGDFPWDFDNKEHPGKALVDARQLFFIQLPRLYDLDPYAISFYATGSKGFHAVIPAALFGAEAGDPLLPLIYKRIASEWTSRFNLSTSDLSLFCMSKGKMFRIANVQRSNGRFKVPLALEEVRDLTIEQITELTKAPREIESIDIDLKPNEQLVRAYQEARAAVYAELNEQKEQAPLSDKERQAICGSMPPCVSHILTSNPPKSLQVNFNRLLMIVINYFHMAGIDHDTAWSKAQALITGYQHSETYDTPEKRLDLWRSLWSYLDNNSGYTFSCSHVLGLKLPGNAFRCNACSKNKGKEQTPGENQDSQPKSDPGQSGLEFTTEELLKAASSEQDGDASIFIRLNRDRFRFDHSTGTWFERSGHYWIEDTIGEAIAAVDGITGLYEKEAHRLSWASMTATKAGREEEGKKAESQRKVFMRKIALLQKVQWKQSVLQLAAAGRRSLGIIGNEWDRNPWILPCINGIVDLKTGDMRSDAAEDFIKTVCPTEWKGINEPAPSWIRFLESTTDDPEIASFKSRLYGSALPGIVIEHILPIFQGGGRNGKGTELEAVKHTLGVLAGPIPSEMLLRQRDPKNPDAPSASLMALRGKRLAWASEADRGRRFNAQMVKWLCGGDTLVGRDPFGRRQVEFTPTHSIFLLTNDRPRANASDFAFWSRVLLVPFRFTFVDNPQGPYERQRDPHLLEKLKAEAPGILAWLVRGCLEWQREGLNPPETVRAETEQYRQDEDQFSRFIEDYCWIDSAGEVKSSELFKAYRQWCDDNGERAVNGRVFGEEIGKKFDSYRKTSGVHYTGLKLHSRPEV